MKPDPVRLTVQDWEIWIAVCMRAGLIDLGYASIAADRRDYELMLRAARPCLSCGEHCWRYYFADLLGVSVWARCCGLGCGNIRALS